MEIIDLSITLKLCEFCAKSIVIVIVIVTIVINTIVIIIFIVLSSSSSPSYYCHHVMILRIFYLLASMLKIHYIGIMIMSRLMAEYEDKGRILLNRIHNIDEI